MKNLKGENEMNLKHLADCIDNDEATIQSFMRNPEFAEYLFREVVADGDIDEIREFKGLIDEAKARARELELAEA